MHTLRFRPLAALALLVIFNACASQASGPVEIPRLPPRVVANTYVSLEMPGDKLDALAAWRHANGIAWLIATAKSSLWLVVFDTDTGAHLRAAVTALNLDRSCP